MKRILSYLGIALVAILAISVCTGCARTRLEQAVAEANKDCPEDLGDGMIMEKFLIEGDDVVCIYELDETWYDLSEMSAVKPLMKSLMIEELRNSNDSDIEEFVSLLKENKGAFICRFKGSSSGKTFDIRLPASQL